MNLERFLSERSKTWDELSALVARAGGKPERLDADSLVRLSLGYRGAVADLALARRKWPSDPVVRRLEVLVFRGRTVVYGRVSQRGSLRAFFSRRYWALVAEHKSSLAIAAFLLFAPGVLAGAWAVTDPGAAATVLPSQFADVDERRTEDTDLGLSGGEQAAFSSQIFTNNIRVTFLAFAGGILAGIGTAAVLLLNGLMLGVVTGLVVNGGAPGFFFELVAPHGVLELSCIVVAAAAGLRMGWVLVDPGHRRRVDAVIYEGRRSVEIVIGTTPWLVLAGLVEGFVTPTGLGLVPALLFGTLLAAAYWALLITRGRGLDSSAL